MESTVVNGNAAVTPSSLSLVELRLEILGLGGGGLGLFLHHQFIVHPKLALWHSTQIALHDDPPRHMGAQGLTWGRGGSGVSRAGWHTNTASQHVAGVMTRPATTTAATAPAHQTPSNDRMR